MLFLSVICVSKMLIGLVIRQNIGCIHENTKLTCFCPQKRPIKSSPHSQLLQNPKSDYYNNFMMHFKHYLPCKLCYCGSFICVTSSKLRTTSMSISQPFWHIKWTFRILLTGSSIHLKLVSAIFHYF